MMIMLVCIPIGKECPRTYFQPDYGAGSGDSSPKDSTSQVEENKKPPSLEVKTDKPKEDKSGDFLLILLRALGAPHT